MTTEQSKQILHLYEAGGSFKNYLVNTFYVADKNNLLALVIAMQDTIFDDLVQAILIHRGLRLGIKKSRKELIDKN